MAFRTQLFSSFAIAWIVSSILSWSSSSSQSRHSPRSDAFALGGRIRSNIAQQRPTAQQSKCFNNVRGELVIRQSSVGTSAPAWIGTLEVQTMVEPRVGATVMPLFSLNKIAWPGTTGDLEVFESEKLKMYEDMILSGKRRYVAALATPHEDDEEDPYIWSVGTILELESLTPISEGKFIAKHAVIGRARLQRVISAGHTCAYNQAEIKMLPPMQKESVHGYEDDAMRLVKALHDLRKLSYDLEEPSLLTTMQLIKKIAHLTTWQLADYYMEWRLSARAQREEQRARMEMDQWVEAQAAKGQDLEEMHRAMPYHVEKIFLRIKHPAEMMKLQGIFGSLCSTYWLPMMWMHGGLCS